MKVVTRCTETMKRRIRDTEEINETFYVGGGIIFMCSMSMLPCSATFIKRVRGVTNKDLLVDLVMHAVIESQEMPPAENLLF